MGERERWWYKAKNRDDGLEWSEEEMDLSCEGGSGRMKID